MKQKHQQDIPNKRQQILDAAYVIFSRKGYHRATVDEIIALADTGKGTVYNYFVNKEQLFYTLIQEKSMPFEIDLQRLVKSEVEPLQKVEALIRLFLEFYGQNGDLWRVMMHEVRGFDVEGYSDFTVEERNKYQAWFHQSIGMIEEVLQEGRDKNVLRPCDMHRAAYGLFSAIVSIVFGGMVDSIEESAKTIADVFLHGVAKK
ncbi:TetR/AcrR family transcriptional regulator [Azotosporobacter soli]|uniref:TetR/AcrR family transcriptional regulator n=1 Tax=Azotosporobacter soli TaxID=3055040 RepID=UPI0031FF317D